MGKIGIIIFFFYGLSPNLTFGFGNGLHPLEMGPRLTGKRLPIWGVFSDQTIVGVLMQLQGASMTSQQNMQQINSFLGANTKTFTIHAGIYLDQNNLRL